MAVDEPSSLAACQGVRVPFADADVERPAIPHRRRRAGHGAASVTVDTSRTSVFHHPFNLRVPDHQRRTAATPRVSIEPWVGAAAGLLDVRGAASVVRC
ncbi:hypothetical protein FXW78_49810 [Rhodococcus opacus]|nr:hypothetical protein [Rhodococcus opacus]